MEIEFEGREFSFKKIISTLFKYKWINFLIVLTSLLLGFFYYYLASPIYESSATIEISANPLENRVDFFGNNMGMVQGTETEIDILRSEFLLNKTLESVDLGVQYFKKSKLKTLDLYEDAPFKLSNIHIKNSKITGKVFYIKYVDKYRYELVQKNSFLTDIFKELPNSLKPKNLIAAKRAVYRYGEVVDLPNVSFIINKKGLYQNAKYSFVLNSYEELIKHIRSNLNIYPASFKSSVLKITYKDTISKRAKDFLNSYIQNYLHYSRKNLVETDSKTLKFINEQLDLIKGKLQNSENSLQMYKQSNNISDLDTQKKQIVDKFNGFKEQLKNAEIELSVIKKLHQGVKRGNFNIISSAGANYPVLHTMLQNLENTKMQREEKLATLTINHPEIISLTKGIGNLEDAILNISKGILDRAKSRLYSLKDIVSEYEKQLQEFPEIEKELVKYERVFAVNDKVYNYLLQKQSELSIEKASTTLNKKVLDFAKQTMQPLSPKLSQILATSVFLGLVLALLHTLLRAKYDTKIKDRYDIIAATDIPIFGTIPFVSNSQKYNSAYVLDAPNSSAGEAFRVIQNNLEYSASSKKSKVILITSSVPNEGKTTVSANLAAILGMGDKRSIILSLDLRRPELHHKFLLSNKLGMSDVLSGKASLKDVIWENENYSNINIITSGAIPPNPAELLSSKTMSDVIAKLKESYDYIVLDTPPFEYVSDSISLIKYADITLFVVKSEFSDLRYIDEINRLTKKVAIQNAGIVLNSVKSKYFVDKKFDYKYIYHEA